MSVAGNLQGAGGIDYILVDDDPAFLDLLGQVLSEREWNTARFAKGEDALIAIDRLYREGRRPAVVLDLVMPRMDGTGILGGLELLELLHRNFSELDIIVISDYHNLEAERKVKSLGCPFLIKPRPGEIADEEKCRPFWSKLLQEMTKPAETEKAPQQVEARVVPLHGQETRTEPAKQEQIGTGISLLRSMLNELNNPAAGGGIILLALRFATLFAGRAIVFSVKDDEIVGLGQSGLYDDGMPADSLVRTLCIPREAPSLFTAVLDSLLPVKAQPDQSEWTRYLFSRIGGVPAEFFLGPIVTGGKVVAVLYADNLPEEKPIGDTDCLEVFLSQAGMAMEKALLESTFKETTAEAV